MREKRPFKCPCTPLPKGWRGFFYAHMLGLKIGLKKIFQSGKKLSYLAFILIPSRKAKGVRL